MLFYGVAILVEWQIGKRRQLADTDATVIGRNAVMNNWRKACLRKPRDCGFHQQLVLKTTPAQYHLLTCRPRGNCQQNFY